MQVSLFDERHLGEKHTFSHNGLTGSYYLTGDPEGVPVLFLHGLTGNHIGMLPMSAHLHKYRCILPDLPGHAKNPIPSEDSPAKDLASWVAAFVRQWENPVIITHSYGGSLAMLALKDLADEVRGCILLNPVVKTSQLARSYTHLAELLRPSISAALNDIKTIRHRRHLYLLERSTPTVMKIMKQLNDAEAKLTTSRERMAYFQKLGKFFDNRATFDNAPKKLASKTYCIVASRDTLVSSDNDDILRAVFGSSHVRVCSGTGHLMPIEAITDTAHMINKILKRITKPAAFFKRRLASSPKS
jgi:pimeloyl-ACP methyl ester carboxylesterase